MVNYREILRLDSLNYTQRQIVHSAEPSGLRCVSERTLCGA